MNKKSILKSVLSYFGRCPDKTRLGWGRVLGWLAPLILRSRVHIVKTNLALCFPNLSDDERKALTKRHFRLLAQSFVDRGLCWFGTAERIKQTIHLHNEHYLEDLVAQNKRILMFAPHYIGLDAAATRITLLLKETATIYTTQSDADVDEIMRKGRSRFNNVYMVTRKDGVRGLIRHLRKGVPIYYLPDMDFGRKGSAFIPFFGVPAATLLSAAHIASAWDAVVIPLNTQLDIKTGEYHVHVGPPLENFPGDDNAEQATARLNRIIEDAITPDPAQYYWVHRRFKTRPEGEPGVY